MDPFLRRVNACVRPAEVLGASQPQNALERKGGKKNRSLTYLFVSEGAKQ